MTTLAVLGASCSSSSITNSTVNTNTESLGPTLTDACHLYTADEATKLLGTKVTPPSDPHGIIVRLTAQQTYSCLYQGPEVDGVQSMVLIRRVHFSSPGLAQSTYDRIKKSAVAPLEQHISTTAGYWVASTGILRVVTGSEMMTVQVKKGAAGDRDLAQQAMEVVLKRLD